MEIEKRKRRLDMGIITLWLHWVMGTGALVLPVLLGIFIPKPWLPVIVLFEVILLYYYIHVYALEAPRCYLIINICARALIVSALLMIAINYSFATGHITMFFEEAALNPQIPFISVLVISPCSFFFGLLATLRSYRQSFCANCVRRYGTPAERGFIGYIYKREGAMQARLLMWLSGVVGAYAWIYYWIEYSNVNLNKPDIFFFLGIPLIFYVLSLIYTGLRYAGLLSYYGQEIVGSARQRGAITDVRYILICDDSVFLAPSDPGLHNSRFDTPFSLTLRYRKEIPIDLATDDFCNISHVPEATVKYLYTSESGNLDGTICHFAALIKTRADFDASRYPHGKWVSFYQIKQMANLNLLAPLLAAEVHRIYTVTMAWKTYDINGRRLYKIKNYRPTFHLAQLPKLDIDYNDNRWLFIAANNEDRRFFRLRRFMKKLMFGRDI